MLFLLIVFTLLKNDRIFADELHVRLPSTVQSYASPERLREGTKWIQQGEAVTILDVVKSSENTRERNWWKIDYEGSICYIEALMINPSLLEPTKPFIGAWQLRAAKKGKEIYDAKKNGDEERAVLFLFEGGKAYQYADGVEDKCPWTYRKGDNYVTLMHIDRNSYEKIYIVTDDTLESRSKKSVFTFERMPYDKAMNYPVYKARTVELIDSTDDDTPDRVIDSSEQIASDDQNGSLKDGDIVMLGYYEQDGNPNNGAEPIEWIVIDKEDNNYMLLSRYVIEYRSPSVAWSRSRLRDWLNGEFYNNAFSDKEKGKIIKTTHDLGITSYIYTDEPNINTSDYVYLLSVSEARKLSETDRKGKVTSYVTNTDFGYYVDVEDGYTDWLLRTPVNEGIARVWADGDIDDYDGSWTYYTGIRPAITIKTNNEE